jgi:hypothetical protein
MNLHYHKCTTLNVKIKMVAPTNKREVFAHTIIDPMSEDTRPPSSDPIWTTTKTTSSMLMMPIQDTNDSNPTTTKRVIPASILELAVSLNNEGVRLFSTHGADASEKYFQVCLSKIFELKIVLREEEIERGAAQEEQVQEDGSMNIVNPPNKSTRRRPGTTILPPAAARTSSPTSTATQKQQQLPLNPIFGWSQPLLYSAQKATNNNKELPPRDDGSFLFSRALLLHDSVLREQADQEQCDAAALLFMLEVCTSAILFNLALVNHIQAICHHSSTTYEAHPSLLRDHQEDREDLDLQGNADGTPSREAFVWNIYQNYERSFIGLKKITSANNDTTKHILDLDVLVLALFNNMGVLFCNEMARFRDADECFQAVSGMVLCLLHPLASSAGADQREAMHGLLENRLSEAEISGLCMNIWMVPKSSTPAA